MPRVSKGALATCYMIIFLDVLNFGIVFPLLPSIARDFNATAEDLGLLATLYSVAQVICTPILGWVSDKIGRRPVLLLAVLGTAASSALTGHAKNYSDLLIARIINGAMGGTMGVANAYIADVTTREEKPVYMSYLSASSSMGVILGPALGGALAHQGFAVACYVSASSSLLNLVIGLVFLKESKLFSHVDDAADGPGVALQGAAEQPARAAGLDRIPCQAIFLYLAGFFMFFGFASFESVTGFYLSDTYFVGQPEASAQFYGALFVFAGVTMFLVAVFIYKPLLRCFGERGTVALGAMLRLVGFCMLGWAPNQWYFLSFSQLMVGGGNLLNPTTSSMLTSIVPPASFGKALGFSQAFQGLARIVGPVSFGSIYDRIGHKFPFYINGIMSPLAMLLIFLVRVPEASQTEQITENNVEVNEAALDGNAVCTMPADIAAQVSDPTAGLTRQLSSISANGLSPSARSLGSPSQRKIASFISERPVAAEQTAHSESVV